VVFCRKSSGVSIWLASWMNWAAFCGLLAEQHAARWRGCRPGSRGSRPAGDERWAVERLELVEVAVVDDAGDHLARVERHRRSADGDAEQLLGVVERRSAGCDGSGAELAVVEPGDDLAAEPDASSSSSGEVVGEPAHAGVHLGAAELSSSLSSPVAIFTSGGPPRKTLERSFDHDDVVAHAGHVGAAGGGVAEHDRDRRDAGADSRVISRNVVPPGMKMSLLGGAGRRPRTR
jgi:hypothetical protein